MNNREHLPLNHDVYHILRLSIFDFEDNLGTEQQSLAVCQLSLCKPVSLTLSLGICVSLKSQ